MPKFTYYIVNPNNEVEGTNEEKVAIAASMNDDNIVINAESNCVIYNAQGQGEIKEQTTYVL